MKFWVWVTEVEVCVIKTSRGEDEKSWWGILSKNCPCAAAAKLLQSCPTLCDPIGGSPPGSPVPGILQARTLEWVAISFSNAWKWKVKVKSLSCIWLLATQWTAAYQAPLSMGFSRQEHWSGVPLPSLRTVPTLALKFSKGHQERLLKYSFVCGHLQFSCVLNRIRKMIHSVGFRRKTSSVLNILRYVVNNQMEISIKMLERRIHYFIERSGWKYLRY